jgi:hypothetical protein
MAFNRTLGHFTSSQELATQWASGQSYILDQLVLDNDKLYRCILAHTSGASFAGDSAYWSGINPGQTIAIAGGGTGQTTQTAAFDALAPTTTAGDIIVHNGTDNVRQGIGSDGQVLVADNTQPNKLKWATLQQGAKNYITYGTFENGATTGWSLFNTTLTSKIPTGSITAGAASITSFAVDSTTPIAGTYDLRVASSGALTAGQGFISDAFTIDREDQAKPLAFSFAYEAVSGTMDFSGTSNNTFAVYIYDVSGSAWIQPAGVYNLVQSSGVGIASGTFQTTATGTQYRIAVVCITATAGAVEMRFDTFQLGPQGTVQGAPVTDWQPYTPTVTVATGTVPTFSSVLGEYRRVGDTIEVEATLTWQTATTFGSLYVSLPQGTIDLGKLSQSIGVLGNCYIRDTGINNYPGVVRVIAAFTDRVEVQSFLVNTSDVGSSADPVLAGSISQAAPFTFASGDQVQLRFVYPAAGLSSSVQMSNDTDTRVVAARVSRSGINQGSINTNNSAKVIEFFSKSGTYQYDTHSAFNASTYIYIAPISGYYSVKSNLAFLSTNVLNSRYFAYIDRSGSAALRGPEVTPGAGSNFACGVNGTIYCTAGQSLSVYIYGVGNNSATPITLDGANEVSYFIVERLSGPATIAASETVAAFASKTSGSHTSSGSWQDVASWSLRDSTHGSFNATTGVFTAPVSGRYLVTGHVAFLGAASGIRAVKVIKISSDTVIGQRQVGSSALNAVVFSGYVQLSAGETVKIQAYQDSGGILGYFTSGEDGTTISIVRVGN